jgi:aminoglycoside phosphotransferase (APT) family kinase protein
MGRRRRARHLRSFREVDYLIEASLRACDRFSANAQVDGRLDSMNRGLFHENYVFMVDDPNCDADLRDQPFMIRLLAQKFDWQHDETAHSRIAREAETLKRLARSEFLLDAPRHVCDVVEDERLIGFIETVIPGVTLESLRLPGSVEYLAQALAAVHALSVDHFDHLPRSESRRQHLVSRLRELDWRCLKSCDPALQAREWIENHLPPDDPPVVLHGDIQTHNLLAVIDWESATLDEGSATYEEQWKIGVVDWQTTRIGDPSYDFAILTHGQRKVARDPGGLRKLLAAYHEYGGRPLSADDVHCHELVLIMSWLQSSLDEEDGTQPADHYSQLLTGLLRRISRT